MRYTIKLTTYAPNEAAESVISSALQFPAPLSFGTLIDVFSTGFRHKNGVFNSKKSAGAVAERINKRGAFGGFGKYAVTASIIEAAGA